MDNSATVTCTKMYCVVLCNIVQCNAMHGFVCYLGPKHRLKKIVKMTTISI